MLTVVLFVAFAVGVLAGSTGAIEIRGYVKDYPATWEQRDSILVGRFRRAWYHSTRGRIRLRAFPTDGLTLAGDAEARLAFHDGIGARAASALYAPSVGLVDLAWQPLDRDHSSGSVAIDRLYIEYYAPRAVVTVGRQRIAWGVANYFSPLDRFAPFAPATIDREEKAGVDAVALSIPWRALGAVEAVAAAQRLDIPAELGGGTETRRIAGIRLRASRRGWDLALLGGSFAGAKSVGGSVAGSIGDAGVRAEALYSVDRVRRTLLVLPPPGGDIRLRSVRGNFVQATIGATYGFIWRSLTLGGEAHWDGSGATEPARYDWFGLAVGRRVTLARTYVAGSATIEIAPLVVASLTALVNGDEPAALFVPEVAWSIAEDADVRAGIQVRAGGGGVSEYATARNLAYAVIAWYF